MTNAEERLIYLGLATAPDVGQSTLRSTNEPIKKGAMSLQHPTEKGTMNSGFKS